MAQPKGVLCLLLVSAFSLASGAVLRDTFAGAQDFTCGRRPVEPSLIGQKIANGHTPKYGSYPWQAGIYVTKGVEWQFKCGGIIIDKEWILTAAQCVYVPSQIKVKVHVGDHNREEQDPSEQHFMAKKLITHDDYGKPTTYNNDIALVKIEPDNGTVIQFDDNVQPACLPSPDTPYTEGKKCLISGWGKTKPDGEASVVLQAAEVPLLSHGQCKEVLKPFGEDDLLTKTQVCAGPVDPYGGICHQDYGGPLVSKEEAGFTVLGITSWTPRASCGKNREPGVFVKVNEFLPWIQAMMND